MNAILSIICGTRHRPESYKRFLDSVIHTASVDTELLIGDASDVQYACDLTPVDTGRIVRIVTAHESPRVGHARGYNRLFKMATGKWITWFNDDCELIDGWDQVAISYMESHKHLGIGCIYFRDNVGSGLGSEFVVQSLYRVTYANFGFLKKSLGDRVGWFDEDLWMYGADTAFSYAVIEDGLAVEPIPGCKVLHYREQDQSRAECYADARNRNDRAIFDGKWKFRAPDIRSMASKFKDLKQPEAIQ